MKPPDSSSIAWEPLTPPGVASFAHAPSSRLFFVQFIFALLAAASVAWFVYDGCFPVIEMTVHNLPVTGEIRSASLHWRGNSPQLLAEDRFLALDVDLNHSNQIRLPSDVQIEFGRKTVRVFSLLGYTDWNYPDGFIIPFNRSTLEPLWGAWSSEFLLIFGVGLAMVFLLCWWLLATVYFLPVKAAGFFANRDLNLRQSWRLSGAALMPGALLMAAAVLAYDFGFLNLVSLGFAFAVHFVLGWVYLFLSLPFVPRRVMPLPDENPFAKRD